MTPINPAAAGGLPTYNAAAGYAPQTVDPAAPGFVQYPDPYAAAYVDPYAQQATVDPTYSMQYADPAAQYGDPAMQYAQPSPGFAGDPMAITSQPAVTSTPAATVEDFAALGIFTEQELMEIAQAPPEQLGPLYERAVAFMQTPEFAQLMQQQGGMQQPGMQGPAEQDPAMQQAQETMVAGSGQGGAAAGEPGKPGWNEGWEKKFKALMDRQGLDSKTQMAVLAQMRSLPLSEAELKQAIAYYRSPQGKAELKAADKQVQAGKAFENKLMLGMGGLAVGAGGATTLLAKSRGNLEAALKRTVAAGAMEGADDAAKLRAASAGQALKELDSGKLPGQLSKAARLETAAALRAQAGATNRALHPFQKMSLNAAARGVTPGTSLGFKESMKYGLMMKFGDHVPDAATGARAVAGGADDAARVATSAAQAAKGASTISKFGRALGPAGLLLGAGLGAYGIKKTMEAEGEFGKESAKMTGNVVGGLSGAVAGAAGGAAIGAIGGPIGSGVGAIVGGVVGGIGVGKIGEKVGGFLHGIFDD